MDSILGLCRSCRSPLLHKLGAKGSFSTKLIIHTCILLFCVYFVASKTDSKKKSRTNSAAWLEDEDEMTPKKIKKSLVDNHIIPDCIDRSPNHSIEVQFFHGYVAKFGNLIPPRNITDHSPHLVSWPGTILEYFTLIMVDLDEPQALYPDERAWLHWMIVNIPGTCRYKGELKARYIRPRPMEDSGQHRYVFVVYKQPDVIEFEEKLINGTEHNDMRRGHFSCEDFSKKYDLGIPHAINFFRAEYQL